MSMVAEGLIAALLVISGLFGLIGSFGLLKLRGAMQRLHAPTKATTVGVGAALIASALYGLWLTGQASWHEILVMGFLFLTAPISALHLAKLHLHNGADRGIRPATPEWAGDRKD